MGEAHIVVGVDGSSESRLALDWAIGLARDLNATVVAVHAAETALSSMFRADASQEYDELRRQLEVLVREDWCRGLVDSGVPSDVLVEDGGPGLVLMAVADRVAALTIVVGPRGQGGSPSLPLGSVGLQLAQYANRAVTIVRGGEDGPAR